LPQISNLQKVQITEKLTMLRLDNLLILLVDSVLYFPFSEATTISNSSIEDQSKTLEVLND
jgi:hypothetical protein